MPMFAEIRKRLNQSPFLKNIILVAGSTAAAQAVTVLSVPITTRLYSPGDFGVLAVFTSVLGIVGQLSTFRYSVTIPLAHTEEAADDVLRLCLSITLGLGIVSTFAVLFLGGSLASVSADFRYSSIFLLFPVCLLGIGFYEALSSWAVRRKNFKVIARTKLSQAVSSSGLKIGLGWGGFGPMGLIMGFLASQAAGTAGLFFHLVKEKPGFFRVMSINGMVRAARRFSGFPMFQSWSRLLLALGTQLPAVFMAALFGAGEAGLFGLAGTVVGMPMNLMGLSVAQVYYAEIARYGKAMPDAVLSLSLSVTKRMIAAALAPMGLIFFAGPWLFTALFGSRWHDAGTYARILSVQILFQFVSTPIMHCLDVLEKQPLQLLMNATRVVLMASVFAVSAGYGLSSKSTVLFYSISLLLYYGATIAVVWGVLYNTKKEGSVNYAGN